MENRGRKMGSDLHFPHLFISLLRGEENGVRSSLSTFVHKFVEFKFELAPAVFFFCARDHLRDRSVGRSTEKLANFSQLPASSRSSPRSEPSARRMGSQKNGVRSSLSTFVHELIEFK